MKLSLLTLFFMSVVASSSYAQYADDIANYRQNRMSMNVSSAEARENLQFSLEAQVLGTSVSVLKGYGLSGGYYLNPDWQIFGSYVTSGPMETYFESTSFDGHSQVGLAASMLGVGSKNYLSNSFYLRSGLFLRNLQASAYRIESYSETRDEASIDISSLGIELAIGNQWQWDNFTLGCDWIGYYRPISVLRNKLESSNGYDDDDIEAARKIGLLGNLNILRFYLGAAF